MKKTLLLIFVALNFFNVSAQEVSVNPNPAVLTETGLDLSPPSFELINHATMTNNSDAEVAFSWSRTIVSAPEEWIFPVCDKNTCWFAGVDAAPDPVNLTAGEEGLLDVHLQPTNVPGCATVTLDITPFDDLTNVLFTATYEFRVNVAEDCTTVISDVSSVTVSKVKVYPNPTTDIFKIAALEEISEATEVAVYNVLGRKVKSFSTAVNNFNVSDLPDGMYLVSLSGENASVIKTVRMSKSSMRP